ncbi:hypothetical protein GF402_04550 [Candidatus Fermentibacteria bacterium]|nr:hypothetical protein [Candidatus Fermentibacteria bacterium]
MAPLGAAAYLRDAMMAFLLSPFLLALLGACVLGWGTLLLPDLSWSRRYGAGAIALYLALAMVGWIGGLHPFALWPFLAAGLVFALKRPRRLLPPSPIVLLVGAVVLLPLAGLPPFSRDAMNHHLYLPRLWLEHGEILRPGWSPYFSYPYLTEALYSLVGGTVGFRVSRLVSLSGLLAAGAAVSEAWRRRGRAALLAPVVLLSMPEALRNATWSYADSYLVLFSVLAFVDLGRKGHPAAMRALVWASAAACCKYNGLIVLLLVCVFLVAQRWRTMEARVVGRGAVVVLVLSATWALPNLLRWGNPVHPLLEKADPVCEREERLLRDRREFGAAIDDVGDVLLLPVRLSVYGEWDDPRRFDGSSGPLLLAGVVLALFLLRSERMRLLGLPLCYLIVAQVSRGTSVRVRYLLPGLAMLSVPAAKALQRTMERGRLIRWVVSGLILVCLAWTGARVSRLYEKDKPWKAITEESYLEHRLPYLRFYRMAAGVAEEDHLTLFVNMGNRAFYFPSEVVYDPDRLPMRLLRMLWSGRTSSEMAGELASDGVDFVAANMVYTSINMPSQLSGPEMDRLRAFFARELDPLLSYGPYVLFKLNGRP